MILKTIICVLCILQSPGCLAVHPDTLAESSGLVYTPKFFKWHPLSSPFPVFSLGQFRVFSNESALHIRWPKYWSFSFSISPSSEYSGPISSRIHWLDLFSVQGTLKSPPTPQFKSINSSTLCFLSNSQVHICLL